MFGVELYLVLGAFALGVLWLNTTLIAAAALKQRASLARHADRWKRDLRRGKVSRGGGAEGVFASRVVRQTGRALTLSGPDRIVFSDGASEIRCAGGELEIEGRGTLSVAQGAKVELWLADAPAGTRGAFDAAFKRASTNKGFDTQVELALGEGTQVWVAGSDEALMVATLDPLAFIAAKRRSLLLFALAAPFACAAVSAVALWPPLFGTISSIGGALCLAFFLAIQPLGTAVRDAARLPPSRPVGGLWQREGSRAAG